MMTLSVAHPRRWIRVPVMVVAGVDFEVVRPAAPCIRGV